MSVPIYASYQKALGRTAEIRNHLGGGHHDHAKKFGELDFQLQVSPVVSTPVNALTSAGTEIMFNLPRNEALFLKDSNSIFLQIRARNTSGVNTIEPTFVESFFNRQNAMQWLADGNPFGRIIPAAQIAIDVAQSTEFDVYQALAPNLLNHNSSLASTSPAVIATNGFKTYLVRVPNPFPTDGWWLGAQKDTRISLRITTANAVDAGTGTLELVANDGFLLLLDCKTVHPDDYYALNAEFSGKTWHTQETVLFESPATVATVATGESPRVQLQSFKDMDVSHIWFFVHLSRDNALSAYWNLVGPAEGAAIGINDKSGNPISASLNGISTQFNKFIRGTKHFGHSRIVTDTNLILYTFTPDLQKRFFLPNHDNGKYRFDGEENLILTNFGTAASHFIDGLAYVDAFYSVSPSGVIARNI